jgi:hypothetical protein
MLVPLLPYYNRVYYQTNVSRNSTDIKNNLEFYRTKIKTDYDENPMNNMILAGLAGSLTNMPTLGLTYTEDMYALLLKILNENAVGLWGNFNMLNEKDGYNDLSLSALFVMMVLTTLGTVSISGSVSETRFYNEAMGIRTTNTCAMPKTFKRVRMTGIAGVDTYTVLNNVFYS